MPDDRPSYSSPPCFMHELDADGAWAPADERQATDVARWRRSERQRLLDRRAAIAPEDRIKRSERIAARLDEALGGVEVRVVGCYWPIKAEPDLRRWMERIARRGATCALPVVVQKNAPLKFRVWTPGCRLERGVWNIPTPADGQEIEPDLLLAPLVGFDSQCFRLGYGGGFFDRTLAAARRRPFVVGVGFCEAEIPTIYPQAHDIPMQVVVTEAGLHRRSNVGAPRVKALSG